MLSSTTRRRGGGALLYSLQCVRGISFFHKVKLGERPVNEDKKAKYADKFKRATKTRLCEEFRATGECVWGDRCLSAHSLGELQPPVYFDLAVELAAKEPGQPSPNHHHLLEAQIQSTLRKRRAFKPVLDSLRAVNGCELGASLMVQYVPQTLLKEQMVEKAYVQVKLPQLATQWFLSEPQQWAVKQVVGQRYKPEKDLFRLTRRNQQPYKEILDYDTVYDHGIVQLYEICKGVRANFPDAYVDSTNCAPVRASTSFTPEYVFQYDLVQGDSRDVFESPFADVPVAQQPSSLISPAFSFDHDSTTTSSSSAAKVVEVHFEPEPVLTRTPKVAAAA